MAAALGDPLDATILFNFPSIRSLAGHLQKQNAPAPVLSDDEFLENLKKNGMQVTELPPAEVAKLREKMKPVIAKHSASVGEATVNAMMAELDKLRK